MVDERSMSGSKADLRWHNNVLTSSASARELLVLGRSTTPVLVGCNRQGGGKIQTPRGDPYGIVMRRAFKRSTALKRCNRAHGKACRRTLQANEHGERARRAGRAPHASARWRALRGHARRVLRLLARPGRLVLFRCRQGCLHRWRSPDEADSGTPRRVLW